MHKYISALCQLYFWTFSPPLGVFFTAASQQERDCQTQTTWFCISLGRFFNIYGQVSIRFKKGQNGLQTAKIKTKVPFWKTHPPPKWLMTIVSSSFLHFPPLQVMLIILVQVKYVMFFFVQPNLLFSREKLVFPTFAYILGILTPRT